MTTREGSYATSDPCSASLEKMTKRLTADLRARVRRLAHCPPLSPDWAEMTDTLQHLASVATIEEKDATKRDGSIWERDELCVRYIIEEGKINLLLRSLTEFKAFQYAGENEGFFQEEETKVRARIFEHSLGLLLKCAFGAVEALQTLDITHLIEHIAAVIRRAIAQGEAATPPEVASQEALVISYLELLLRHVDQLNEETVMGQLEKNGVVGLVLRHHELFGSKLEKELQESYALFLAGLMETETYQTHRAKYICDKDDKRRLALLEPLVKSMLSVDSDRRRALRALNDNIIRFK
eukprot:TRINITY_DN55568_c0_g1_i1.p2 TRINITY_DN55568_c0_g1~~TRINITY_DN55568_c0_g1_i1.p2  ORF type:complete len:313 (-),score=70.02 TRINITY_DN55568_c0_g1_i1:1264-2151(-)